MGEKINFESHWRFQQVVKKFSSLFRCPVASTHLETRGVFKISTLKMAKLLRNTFYEFIKFLGNCFFSLLLHPLNKEEEEEDYGEGRICFVVIHKWNKLYYHHPEYDHHFHVSEISHIM
jgi:hypothetical protein